MSPPGSISGYSLAALNSSCLKKSLIDYLFVWSIISRVNLKANLMSSLPSTGTRERLKFSG